MCEREWEREGKREEWVRPNNYSRNYENPLPWEWKLFLDQALSFLPGIIMLSTVNASSCIFFLFHLLSFVMSDGLPSWISVKESAYQCRRCRRPRFDPWVGSRKWQPTVIFLPGKFHRQGSLVGYSPWGCKESNMIEWLRTQTNTHNGPGTCPGWRYWDRQNWTRF